MSMQTKVETLELRVSPAVKDLVRRAAAARGQTMTDFVLSIVEPAATEIVEQQHQIRLSRAAWEQFVRLTSEESEPPELARAEAAEFLAKYGSK